MPANGSWAQSDDALKDQNARHIDIELPLVDDTVSDEEDLVDEEDLPLQALDSFDADLGRVIGSLTDAIENSVASEQDGEELSNLSKRALQALYALARESVPGLSSTSGLPQLYVDGFDSEQIWGQLEAGSKPALRKARKQIKSLHSCEAMMDEETEATLDELLRLYNQGTEAEPSGTSDDDSEPMSGAENDVDQALRTGSADPRKDRVRNRLQRNEAVPHKRLPTEDDFFSLNDMERFVQDAEATAARPTKEDSPEGTDEGTDSDGDEPADSDLEGLDLDAIHGLGEEGSDSGLEPQSDSDEDDAALARLLEEVGGQEGRPHSKKRRRAELEDEEDEDNDIYYTDFFGREPANKQQPTPAANGKAEQKAAELDNLSDFEMDASDEEANGADTQLGDDDEEEEDDGPGSRSVADDSDGQEQLLSTLRSLINQKKEDEAKGQTSKTAHELRQARIAEKARRLEEENMTAKDWHMRGEVRAGSRPLNSALEVDLDFERALKPPPLPTEEFTMSLEDLIKRRIAELQFDDPMRKAAPTTDLQKDFAEIDDKKANKGLGEEYADDFVRQKTGNVVEDKDEATRRECRVLLKTLFAKLDALSHFHFAPKPIIKEMAVQKEVPALAMEEVAPQVVSEAARQLPEEAFQIDVKTQRKQQREAGERNRKTTRTSMKRAVKKRKANEAEERVQRGDSADGVSNVIGRKSAKREDEVEAAAKHEKKKQKRARTRPDDGPKIKYNKSSAVFGKLQDAKDGHTAKIQDKVPSSKSLKFWLLRFRVDSINSETVNMQRGSPQAQRENCLKGKKIAVEITKEAGAGYHVLTFDQEFIRTFSVGKSPSQAKSILSKTLWSSVMEGELNIPETPLTLEQVKELSRQDLKRRAPSKAVVTYELLAL